VTTPTPDPASNPATDPSAVSRVLLAAAHACQQHTDWHLRPVAAR
jgi:hypothetical protein